MRSPVMEGRGYYNAHSGVQARSAESADTFLETALATVALSERPLVLADFGSSQGRNSMRQMALALDRLALRAPDRDVMVVHSDLPGSDFTSLFETLESAPASYLRGRPRVFASAIGRSFYGRLLPAESLTFGWSAFALHWLSAAPMPLGAHIWPMSAAPDEAGAFAHVAAADWLGFLACRAAELVPGGQLVLVVGAADETGATGLEPLMDLADEVLRALVAETRLDAAAYAAMTVPARPRRRDEFTAPFAAGALPDLALDDVTIGPTPHAALIRWGETGDGAALAADVVGFFVAAFGPSLFGDDGGLRDLFAARLASAVERQPEVVLPLVTATLRITRR